MEESALTPTVVARIVLGAQNRAAADKAKANQGREEFRRRKKQFKAHMAKRRKTNQPELEEGEIQEKETNNTTNSNSPVSPRTFTPFQRLPTPVTPINELCPTFCTTGTCTAICPSIHDSQKTSLCPSVVRGELCAALSSARCRLSHTWSFHVAPSCANYMMGCCYATPCTYAHHDYVSTFSPVCKQFSKLGYCDSGHECHNIHWRGRMLEVVEIVKQKAKEDTPEHKLEVARVKLKESMKVKVPAPAPQMHGKAVRRLLKDGTWTKEMEVVVRGETTGELALQENFVPF